MDISDRERERRAVNLEGRHILVTGVSRPRGIGAALTRRLARAGAVVSAHGYAAYDGDLGYPDASAAYAGELARELSGEGLSVTALPPSDLSRPGEAERVIAEAAEKYGGLSGLVLNHAYSVNAPLGEWTAEHIDAHLAVNVRASMLLIQAFASRVDGERGGSITLFTSGQYLGPMTGEIAYAVSKEAVRCLCAQAAAALAQRKIRVNCVNPGPNDTGYLEGAQYEAVRRMFPAGRWGTPEDAADLVLFLQSDLSAWITGQTIASEGGFRRDGAV